VGAIGVLLVVLAIYLPGLDAAYYADDFQFIFGAREAPIRQAFDEPNAHNHFYRPFEAVCLTWIQERWGVDPRPVHATILLLHLANCLMVGLAGCRLGLRPVGAWIAAGFMGGSQAAVHAIQSLDTLSQVSATGFGLLALAAAASAAGQDTPAPYAQRAAGATTALAAALLCKETGVSAAPGQILLLAWGGRRAPRGTRWKSIAAILALAGVVGAYLFVRALVVGAGPSIGDDRYDFHPGVNIVRNLALLAFSAILPSSSVQLFLAAGEGRWAAIVPGLAGATATMLLIFFGCRRSGRRVLWGWLVVLGIVAAFPMAALNHVSELYSYNLLPFAGLIVGLAAETLLERSGRAGRRLIGALLVGMLVLNMTAARSKSAMMEERGVEATRLLADLRTHLEGVAQGGEVRIVEQGPRTGETDYSVFLMQPLDLLRESPGGVARAAGRPDVRLLFGAPPDAPAAAGEGHGPPWERVLVIVDGRLVPAGQP
jgi:hypothetical protein